MISISNPKGQFKTVDVTKEIDGVLQSRAFVPTDDISNEPPEVQTACNEAWTDEIIEAYKAHLESVI